MQDAEAVLLYALQHPRLKNSRMVAFGRSLGGAVAISLAQAFPDLVSGVVVENTFLSVSDMVDVVLPLLTPIKALVLFMKWHSYLKVQDLTMPMLFISGDADQLVPPAHMRRLYELSSRCTEKEFYSVLGGTHNDTFEVAGAEYYRRLRAFMRMQVRARTGPEAQAHADAMAKAQVQKQSDAQTQASVGVDAGTGDVGGSDGPEEGYEIVDSPKGKSSLRTMDKSFGVK
jgi:pimeloyl-ACP methyl ester carboxylesterase